MSQEATMKHLEELQESFAIQYGQKVDLYHDEATRRIVVTPHESTNSILQVIQY